MLTNIHRTLFTILKRNEEKFFHWEFQSFKNSFFWNTVLILKLTFVAEFICKRCRSSAVLATKKSFLLFLSNLVGSRVTFACEACLQVLNCGVNSFYGVQISSTVMKILRSKFLHFYLYLGKWGFKDQILINKALKINSLF